VPRCLTAETVPASLIAAASRGRNSITGRQASRNLKLCILMSYKRNQIEEAIARALTPDGDKASSELRTRIKRLLELDRAIGRKPRSKAPEEAQFAFFSEEAPGTGADILFSEYEAFALLNALRIMEHGLKQGFAVSTMRRVRSDLESEHARILRQSPDQLFDRQLINANAQAGDIVFDNTDPVFLTLASKTQSETRGKHTSPSAAVCHGFQKVGEFSRAVRPSGVTMLELATVTHQLHEALQKTKPRHRGRG
jgi:hypothetical protein